MRRGHRFELFFVSFAILFIELLLIRWISTEVNVFAYLQNSILVAAFIGLGIGCLSANEPVRIANTVIALFGICLVFALPIGRELSWNVSRALSVGQDLVAWYGIEPQETIRGVLLLGMGLAVAFLFLVSVWQTFLPLGRILGRLFDEADNPLTAYSINIAGSIAGLVAFSLCGYLWLPPSVWTAIAAVVLWPFVTRFACQRIWPQALLLALPVLASCSTWTSNALSVKWSPYQKLSLVRATVPIAEDSNGAELSQLQVFVNNVPYQGMVHHSVLDPAQPEARLYGYTQYDIPLLVHPAPHSVLLVGAGTGNDAAGAIRNGAQTITAVEIDPVILHTGRQLHPDKPYDSSRVKPVVDDARAFFANTSEKYDVISFGLLDSHTTGSMTNTRLDHYVYTIESLRHARRLLRDGGVLSLTFEAQRPFIADRFHRALTEVFGREPFAVRIPGSIFGWGGVMFLNGDMDAIERRIAEQPRLLALLEEWRTAYPLSFTNTTKVIEDNWPYLYLERATIPKLYFMLSALMLVPFLVFRRLFGTDILKRGKWTVRHGMYFSLGAAFLLLETRGISAACVALGSTWIVTAIIVNFVLLMILLANFVAGRTRTMPVRLVFLLLIALCAALYFIGLSNFVFLPYWPRAIVVGLLTTLPLFLSGLLFATFYREETRRDEMFGANIIGALAGGLLQPVSFVAGMKFLIVLVIFFYGAAWLCYLRQGPQLRNGVRP